MKKLKLLLVPVSIRTRRATALLAAVALLVAGGMAHAAQEQAIQGVQGDIQQIPVETYHYGMKLDIARVLSISDTSQECGVVPSIMRYEDSSGAPRALEYQIYGGGCSDN
ncbi:TPA: DUF2790 domain-containing protein [Pseudomonas aeruginosa]|uniref:DUF2790 domain-containing protein n=4 Tax=Pseudomonadaceae TaxID=135621 RepID=A0A2T5PIE1_ECTOL|nr:MULTISPECIES: DUF2790 domain-containing protein [Pseudomonas]AYF72226.1 DUF2790 domain-containing protein [Pseudomonas aeruginosa]EIU1656611.1 DUF2790 domain-containing protein [Pseudomonas aeruginosa]ELC8337448.1 DUF2790 domain-containing protein [Pseudomonas aeruginosa]ELE1001913.1 DUF2790 domain-containing protein [Pseudomonas aeruginosa]ELF5752431.1 DUF2790 domain-containing protein [Pseudomonas aeruginosa]